MDNMLINVDQLNDALQKTLKEYNENVVKGLKKQTKRAMKDLVANTKADAPVGKGSEHYRDFISSKTVKEDKFGIEKMWYVKGSYYRLSHLLNNGHATRNGGRVAGTNFIGKNTDRIITWYLPVIEEILKNG